MTGKVGDFELIEEFMIWKVKKLTDKTSAILPDDIRVELESRIGGQKLDDSSFAEWSENQACLSPKERQEYSSLKRIAEISETFKYLGGGRKGADNE